MHTKIYISLVEILFLQFPQLLVLKPRTKVYSEFEKKIVKIELHDYYEKTSKYSCDNVIIGGNSSYSNLIK